MGNILEDYFHCTKHDIYFKPDPTKKGDPICPVCLLEDEVIELNEELSILNDRIDAAQEAGRKAVKTVDDVMEEKLEKATDKALGKKKKK